MDTTFMEANVNMSTALGLAGARPASKIMHRATFMQQPRPLDDAIHGVMFLCGVVSIFTTIAIVVVLGSEALRFFNSREYVNTNKRLSAPITADMTVLPVESGGRPVAAERVVRVGEELMLIEAVLPDGSLAVVRGYEDTPATDHNVTALFLAEDVSLVEFLTNNVWQPQASEFGILPLLNATLMTSAIAMLIALPVGLGAAVYLSEYASPKVRATLKPILEILAGIPTVVYGYFALTFMTPLLRTLFGTDTVQVYNVASAGLVMGIMIVPTISSMSEDALSAVPRSLREASYGLGATRLETIFRVLLPAALSGIVAAFIVGVSRAVGETMIVAVAAGAGPRLTANPFESAETITGHIARISTGDLSFGSIDYNSLFALGLALFVLTFGLNVIAGAVTRRFREAYQ